MVAQMDKEGFGACTNIGACEAACPKEISITNIARLNAEYLRAGLTMENKGPLRLLPRNKIIYRAIQF